MFGGNKLILQCCYRLYTLLLESLQTCIESVLQKREKCFITSSEDTHQDSLTISLKLSTLGEIFSIGHFEIVFLFFLENRFD